MENSDDSGGFRTLEDDSLNFDGNPDWAPDGEPTCDEVTAGTLFNTPVSVPLVCTDTGPAYEQAPVAEVIASAPANGTLSVVEQGDPSTVTYTPTPGFSGSDSFTFSGQDRNGNAVAVTATVNVGADAIAPLLTLSGKKGQKLDGRIEVGARCDETCEYDATGKLVIKQGGGGGREELVIKRTLKPAEGQGDADEKLTLSLKVPKKARRTAGNALDDDRGVKAKLTVVATDGAGNTTTEKRTVTLRD